MDLVGKDTIAENLVGVCAGVSTLHRVHQILTPAVVELDSIVASSDPGDRWRPHIMSSQQICVGIVNCVAVPNLREEQVSDNLSVAAAVEVSNPIADHENRAIPGEVSAHIQSAFNE